MQALSSIGSGPVPCKTNVKLEEHICSDIVCVYAGVHGSYAESEALSTMGPGAQMMAASVDPSHFVSKGFTKGKRQPGRKPPRPHRLKKSGRVYDLACSNIPLIHA